LVARELISFTTGTSGEKGTGFGLTLIRDILEGHGGSLSVESTKEKGSVFYARLPYVRPKVLVIDDSITTRNLIKHSLKEEGLELLEAENGREAVEILEKTLPYLNISDIEMPLLYGFELLQR